jgi:carboxyl-terminal processing protease
MIKSQITKKNHMIRRIIINLTVFTFLCFPFYLKSQNNEFEVIKNLDIFTSLFKELDINYVDQINPGELMQTGVDAMLESLDPYTTYIPESEIEDYQFITTGQYGGIGSLIHLNNDYVIISEPYKNFPADKAGIKAGDKILEVNGKPAKGKSTSDVSKILKGQPGTSLTILIERSGVPDPIEKHVIREQIKIPNIPYYGMLENNLGYIKLTGFTQHAGRDVKQALFDLKENSNLAGIILDLRGNGGGLLQEAVNTVNIFIEKGEYVVSTKGKLKERTRNYNTMNAPIDPEIPLVILVDNSSASASEIVAGAIQDIDRGVIIGQRTFGKGLVQNVIPLTYNTRTKVTVAKYYIPSGRCIQAVDYSHKDEDGHFTKIPDSLISEFQTKNGRLVYDGGGIEPDIYIDPIRFSNIAYSVFSKRLVFDFATDFYWSNDSIAPPGDFEVNEKVYNDFLEFISEKDYTYTSRAEQKLLEFKKIAEREKCFEKIEDNYDMLIAKIENNKKNDLMEFKDEIEAMLKLEIVTRYYYTEGRIEALLVDDPDIKKAIEILANPLTYNGILDGSLVFNKKEKQESSN